MRIRRESVLRWLIDPSYLEEILGDLTESRGTRTGVSHLRDVLSVCVRQSRLRTIPRSLALPLVAAIAALFLLANPAPIRTVLAADDAGPFSIRFAGREVVGATLAGNRVPPDRIVRHGETLILRDARGGEALRLRILGASNFTWQGRAAPRDSLRQPL
ncbi:MAG: hypothetical protein V4558_15375 [Gemmatimonadota bacterium]